MRGACEMDAFLCLLAWRGTLCSPAHIMYDINEDLIFKSFRYLIQCKRLLKSHTTFQRELGMISLSPLSDTARFIHLRTKCLRPFAGLQNIFGFWVIGYVL